MHRVRVQGRCACAGLPEYYYLDTHLSDGHPPIRALAEQQQPRMFSTRGVPADHPYYACYCIGSRPARGHWPGESWRAAALPEARPPDSARLLCLIRTAALPESTRLRCLRESARRCWCAATSMIVLARHLAAPAIAVLPLPVPNAISAMFVAGHAKFHCLCPASTVRLPRMSHLPVGGAA